MRVVVICPDEELQKGLAESFSQDGGSVLAKFLDAYPSPEAFGRLVRSWAPEVVFLSLEDPGRVSELCEQLDAEFPGLQRIGLAATPEPIQFRLAMRLCMRELLSAPIDAAELRTLNAGDAVEDG